MKHVFDRYNAKHGHFPRVVVANGVQRLTVEFHPGYVRVHTSSPVSGEIFITAQAARELLRERSRLRSLLSLQDRVVDVPKRMHAYFVQQAAHDQDLRQQKALRRQGDPEKAARQAQRYQRARERRLRRESPET